MVHLREIMGSDWVCPRPWKVILHDGAVGAGKVHADDFDSVFAFETAQIPFQRSFASPQNDAMHLASGEVAEGGGKAVFPGLAGS